MAVQCFYEESWSSFEMELMETVQFLLRLEVGLIGPVQLVFTGVSMQLRSWT